MRVFDATRSFGVIATSAAPIGQQGNTPTWPNRWSAYFGTPTAGYAMLEVPVLVFGLTALPITYDDPDPENKSWF
jgi:hypothetical protein